MIDREDLIIDNIKLIHKVYNDNFKNTHYYISKEDLISEGYIGLINGIDSYNKNKGISLSTYMYICIKNQMIYYCNREYKHKNNLSFDEIQKDYQ
jgi:RNA polymerase sigma factor (sigma-70 family)